MCGLAMPPTIIDRSRNRRRRSAPTVVAEPVQQPMPPTDCPKLRQMREMIAAEEAAKVQDDRAQRQAAAIEKWHVHASRERQSRRSSSLGSICAAPV